MNKRPARIAWAVATIVLLSATSSCAPNTPPEPGPSQQPRLAETEWLLEALGPQGSLRPALAGIEVTLTFGQDLRVSGTAGCNSYFGEYASQQDGSLHVSAPGSTKMFCNEPGVMQQEQDFLNALATAQQYDIENGLLHISGGAMELVMSKK